MACRSALVGVRVVVVVLDPPRLEGVHQRREHERAHNVLQQLVLAEAAVPAVVPHHEELRSVLSIQEPLPSRFSTVTIHGTFTQFHARYNRSMSPTDIIEL